MTRTITGRSDIDQEETSGLDDSRQYTSSAGSLYGQAQLIRPSQNSSFRTHLVEYLEMRVISMPSSYRGLIEV